MAVVRAGDVSEDAAIVHERLLTHHYGIGVVQRHAAKSAAHSLRSGYSQRVPTDEVSLSHPDRKPVPGLVGIVLGVDVVAPEPVPLPQPQRVEGAAGGDQAQRARNAEQSEWASSFPINELVKRGYITERPAKSARLASVLSFFGVASVEAWQDKWQRTAVAYRHSPSFQSDHHALAAWLRMGELEAEQISCEPYDESAFRRALRQTRGLTQDASGQTFESVSQLCARAGVFVTPIQPLPKTALSGAARWLTPRKALIQLTARGMADDRLWFSLFHEAAHILLQSKKRIFVHGSQKGAITAEDAEADRWASDFLISARAWRDFVSWSDFTEADVVEFAEHQGIAPGSSSAGFSMTG